ncbi:hypothetical protein ILYODFUR_007250 [Ilyodon furcidens]|uniref:Uncharacterized protein n=1 Tax=Ilyodon furcidens TaxID=33524 RepID=A0ABV0UPT6_9TELE
MSEEKEIRIGQGRRGAGQKTGSNGGPDKPLHSTPPHSHYHYHHHVLLPSNPKLLFASASTSASLQVASSLTPETWSPSGSESNNTRLCSDGWDTNTALHSGGSCMDGTLVKPLLLLPSTITTIFPLFMAAIQRNSPMLGR